MPCQPREFTGKRVLVTGGTKGVGQAIEQRFQLADAKVATACAITSPGVAAGAGVARPYFYAARNMARSHAVARE